ARGLASSSWTRAGRNPASRTAMSPTPQPKCAPRRQLVDRRDRCRRHGRVPVHRVRQERRENDAIGDAGGGRHQDVRVAAPKLRVRLERRVPAQGFRAPHVGGEGVDRACFKPKRERHRQLAPSKLPISAIALSRTATTRSISGRVMTKGGESTTVLPRWRPPPERPTITPFRRAKSTTPFMR